jgi:hypothetical protein
MTRPAPSRWTTLLLVAAGVDRLAALLGRMVAA